MGWNLNEVGITGPSSNNSSAAASDLQPSIKIWHRFSFSSHLKRMSCIISTNRSHNDIRLVCKGAAEVIGQRLMAIPSYYDIVHQYFSKQGFRVLALAWKPIKTLNLNTLKNRSKMKQLKRGEFETDMRFAGFLIFACPHKPDSLDTIVQLQASSHAVVMITGLQNFFFIIITTHVYIFFFGGLKFLNVTLKKNLKGKEAV